jgi:hypothetical protein
VGVDVGVPEPNQLVSPQHTQVCYLLRNLSFLRGSKARVLCSRPLLSFLLDCLVHPSLKVRVCLSVCLQPMPAWLVL